MRKLICILTCLITVSVLYAVPPLLRYRGSIAAGTVMRGSIIEPWIGKRPVLGGEVAIEFVPTGKWKSLQWYNNAQPGIALSVLDLTNTKILGEAISPYIYLNIPIVNRSKFVFGLRPGIGLSFVTKNYYNTVPKDMMFVPGSIQYPISNGGTGSVVNIYFAEAIYAEFPIKDGFSLLASYGWYHISNGSIRQPNSGFNMFNGQLGVIYNPDARGCQCRTPKPNVPKHLYEGKRWDVEIWLGGGIRQAYFADNKYFGVWTFSAAAHYRPWSIFKIGGGVDLFYDGFYKSVCNEFAVEGQKAPITLYGKTYLAKSELKNCFRLGVSVQPEFILGNFTVGFHAGVYLYDPIKNLEPYDEAANSGGKIKRGMVYKYNILDAGVKQDGWLYTHVVLKYRVTDYLFIHMGMKSHFSKVEFFDAGLGVAL